MTRAALALCVLLAAAAMGCAGEGAHRADRALHDRASGPRLPRGCRPAEVAGLLHELFGALNRGEREAAAALVIDPAMLRRLERAAAGRPLRLRAVIVGFGNGLGQIEFRAAGRLVGKGAVDCPTGRLVAVGLGRERSRMAPLCRRRPRAGGPAIACVRHWS
jgi:hypothetical protein